MIDTSSNPLKTLKSQLSLLRDEGMSYAEIGKLYGVNKGIIHMILHKDYEPDDPEIRYKLGLDGPPIEIVMRVARRDERTGRWIQNE